MLQKDPQAWDIGIDTTQGKLALRMGGNFLKIEDKPMVGENTITGECPTPNAGVARPVNAGQSDVDLLPGFDFVEAMTLGRRVVMASFHF